MSLTGAAESRSFFLLFVADYKSEDDDNNNSSESDIKFEKQPGTSVTRWINYLKIFGHL